MEERYVISIKATKNLQGEQCEEWRYVAIDVRSGYPDWEYSPYHCKNFYSVESAETWFNENKKYLFGEYYDRFGFVMATLAIRKIIYKTMRPLTADC